MIAIITCECPGSDSLHYGLHQMVRAADGDASYSSVRSSCQNMGGCFRTEMSFEYCAPNLLLPPGGVRVKGSQLGPNLTRFTISENVSGRERELLEGSLRPLINRVNSASELGNSSLKMRIVGADPKSRRHPFNSPSDLARAGSFAPADSLGPTSEPSLREAVLPSGACKLVGVREFVNVRESRR